MKEFLTEDFLLSNDSAKKLYHDYAEKLPIIDYHCHLPTDQIAADKSFKNITEIWLGGDHYKWRAMRSLGVNENFITGKATDYEKFEKWAHSVPYTMRNPLYHWTHLELKRYFGVSKLLNAQSCKAIHDECNDLLQTPEFTTRGIQRKMKVELLCTTDDPADSLEYHKQLSNSDHSTKVLPTFRPDNILKIDDLIHFNDYVKKLEAASGKTVTDLNTLLDVLQSRVDYFHHMGCRLSDHGLNHLYADDFSMENVNKTVKKALSNTKSSADAMTEYRSCLLFHLSQMYHAKNWTQQYHLGALRGTNSRLTRNIGADVGVDSIGDYSHAEAMAKFFDRLDNEDTLAKTILYNLNPSDNEVFGTMVGNFNDGSLAGKMQFGSGWWFLDQKDGMEKQMNTLSNMGMLSQFVGMVTDSRSFLSYPRHEYFRRILCNLIGTDIENGELPDDIEWLGKMVSDISYHNAKNYFGFNV